MRNWKLTTILICCLFLLVACGQEAAPTPAPSPPAATVGEATEAPPTETAIVTQPLPPPTLAPQPTSTSAAEAEAPADSSLLSAADFGPDRNPLTGEEVDDPARLQRRPIAVKLSNAPAQYTRPQSGLNDADFVYEHTTEGAITRFTAIIYGKTPPKVGPIRSARLIDLELPAMYDAALVYSGSSAGVGERLRNADFWERILTTAEAGYYRTGENKPVEHTLYGDPEQFWQVLEAKGLNTAPAFTSFLSFRRQPPAGGEAANQVTIDYQWTLVEWRYDETSGRYHRWADGEVHSDGNTGEQVTAANVIVISPLHVEDPSICEEIRNGVCAHLSVQVQLWGTGSGTVFRDGQQYNVTWERIDRSDMLTFKNSEGNPFPLQIGNSWVQVVPSWLSDPVSVTP